MATTLDGIDLGYIQSERHKISAPKIALPETSTVAGAQSADTASTYLAAITKPTRRISISGIKVGTTAELQSFADSLEALSGVDTGDTTYNFVSDFRNKTYDVLVEDVDVEYVAGEVEMVEYALVLVEGTTA